MTKERVLEALRNRQDQYVSGAALAESLHVSRTAVWKAVEQLRREGYPIESLPRMGHRLSSRSDVLSEFGIRQYLSEPGIRVQVFDSITSTNTVLKQMAAEDAPEGTALVAAEQTAGRGRMGRSFYSPKGSGLYLSLLLRPERTPRESTRLTACAAVAVAEAMEEIAKVSPEIKWVNDLLVRGKKVCGILTEAGLDFETGRMSYVIVGIGINLRRPERDFPEELRGIAGPAFGSREIPDVRNRLAAGVLNRLMKYARDPEADSIWQKYRDRLMVLGKQVLVLSPGQEPVQATALDLERDYALRVRLANGEEQILRSGEISIHVPEAADGNLRKRT